MPEGGPGVGSALLASGRLAPVLDVPPGHSSLASRRLEPGACPLASPSRRLALSASRDTTLAAPPAAARGVRAASRPRHSRWQLDSGPEPPTARAPSPSSRSGSRAAAAATARVHAAGADGRCPGRCLGRTSAARGTVGMDVAGRRLLFRDTSGAVVAFDLVGLPGAGRSRRGARPRRPRRRRGAAHGGPSGRGGGVRRPWGSAALARHARARARAPSSRRPTRASSSSASRGGDSLVGLSRDGGAYFAAVRRRRGAGRREPGRRRRRVRDGQPGSWWSRTAIPRNPWFGEARRCSPRRPSRSPRPATASTWRPRDRSELAVVDRFQRAQRGTIGPPGAGRGDPADGSVGPRARSSQPAAAKVPGRRDVGGERRDRARRWGISATEWDTDLPMVSQTGRDPRLARGTPWWRGTSTRSTPSARWPTARGTTGSSAPGRRAGAAAALRRQARAAGPAPAPHAAAPVPAAAT